MLTLIEKLLFLVLAGGAGYMVSVSFGRLFAIVQRGTGPDTIPFDQLPQRLFTATKALITQGNIIRNRTFSSLFHWGVAWGFIFYFLVNAVDTLEGYLPLSWHIWDAEHDHWWGNLYRLSADFLTITVLVGVLYFLFRRFIAQDKALSTRENVKLHPKARAGGIKRDSLIVALFILLHVGSRFVGASTNIALTHADGWQPFANTFATLLDGASSSGLTFIWHLCWWFALGSILVFLPYFPYTKHAHLFLGPINIATRPDRGALGALHALDFEDEENEKFGVSTLSDLSQTQILDAFSCIMCNRCQEVCPAYITGKELSPAAIEINKRYHIKDNFLTLAAGGEDALPMLDYAMSESALWACTSCGACVDVCPVGNEPLIDIMDLRRAQVLMEDNYPHELTNAFQGLERRGNPWGATISRMEWAQNLPFSVPTVDDNPEFEYLFWVGCAGAFDPNAQRVAQSVATILNAAGVSYAVLGDQETCTGDPARRAGNEYMFFEMASANIETLNGYNVHERKIVTSCPHCFTSLGTEYKAFGGDYVVFHHTQMIADLVGRSKIKLNENKLEHMTFHDPCFLGRHNGIYDDPRIALEKAGVTLLEMPNNKSNSFCCGAGGAQVWKEEEAGTAAVSETRYTEAEATGATTVAVGCPFCAVMLNDAKGKHDNTIDVKDVAEIIAERLA